MYGLLKLGLVIACFSHQLGCLEVEQGENILVPVISTVIIFVILLSINITSEWYSGTQRSLGSESENLQ